VTAEPSYDIVVPTVGRACLGRLLTALERGHGPLPGMVVLVDDRPAPTDPLDLPELPRLDGLVKVVPGAAAGPSDLSRTGTKPSACTRGPASARNRGWRAASAPWVAFLDDDVVPDPDWAERLAADLAAAAPDVAGSAARLRVPLPGGRRPTDWERNVAGLADARWITADLAYRRDALAAVGGFDERFPRAYREDADLGLRLTRAGWRITTGRRTTAHPARPADFWVSVRLQAGNADDALMAALHGPGWREAAGVPPGRRPLHLVVTAAGLLGLAGLAAGRRRIAAAGALLWAAGTAELTVARVRPGPRTPAEVTRMIVTSAALPAAASWHWLRGLAGRRRLLARPGPVPAGVVVGA
jgi:hypothetical protein